MTNVQGKGQGKAVISAKITRADGTVEDLGQISGVEEKDANSAIKLLRKIKGTK